MTISAYLFDEKRLPWLAALSAVLVASWVAFQAHGFTNNDGVLYIEVAKQFSNHEWKKGLALYNWPFYPALLATLHSLTGLTFQEAGTVLTVMFFALSSTGLVLLVKELGGDRRVMLFAAILLLCSPYIVRNLLPMVVMRDHGFLAFHVWSVVFFLRFRQNPNVKKALWWGVAAILATLFRIEGIIYLALLPVVLLVDTSRPWTSRFVLLLKSEILPLIMGLLLFFILLWHGTLSIEKLGRLGDPISFIQLTIAQLTHGLSTKADLYGATILGPYLKDYAFNGILLTLLLVLIVKIAASAGWLQLLLAVLPSRMIQYHTPRHILILKWLAVIGIGNAIIVLLSVFVLSTRYLLPLAILILIFSAFGLDCIARSLQNKRLIYGIALILLLQFVANIRPPGADRLSEIDAAHWVRHHASQEQTVFFDDGRMRYYAYGESSERRKLPWVEMQKLLTPEFLARYDYIVVHVSPDDKDQKEFLRAKLGAPVISFGSLTKKHIEIFALSHEMESASPP
ncbi:MAG: glycosyltransferase family 39 protein [Methylobacillus sp.]|jgi:hypothetical protein|nr:glycosyltransferase family 39 protein [Methylobacillus sp.]